MPISYPLDPDGTTFFDVDAVTPYPPFPFNRSSLLAPILSPSFHDWTLQASTPLTFSILYYVVAHLANRFQSGFDRSKGSSLQSQILRSLIIVHNAALCAYSFLTFVMMAPVVLDLFWQGYRAAGWEGMQLALCSMPTNYSLLGRWTYLFYLSKYYEVIDSLILYLKGKRIGNLQSYHHAGALICMWIAYRYQSQPVWVFCVFNSGVHTFMYAYYFCSALRLPFPKALKRNLTTLQIAQIASGTILTNLYFLQHPEPQRVLAKLTAGRTASLLSASFFGSDHDPREAGSSLWSIISPLWSVAATHTANRAPEMQLSTYAQARSSTTYLPHQSTCLERKGAELALHVNTMYMLPLLALFANFFIRSYAQRGQASPAPRQNGKRVSS